MHRHHLRIPGRLSRSVATDRPVSEYDLRSLIEENCAACRRAELTFHRKSSVKRIDRRTWCVAGLSFGETAQTFLRSDPDALQLTIDRGPLLVSQSSEQDGCYADQVEHLRCERCGSHDVEDARWIEAATLEFMDSCSSIGNEVYCRTCQEQTPCEYGSLAEWRRTHPSVPG